MPSRVEPPVGPGGRRTRTGPVDTEAILWVAAEMLTRSPAGAGAVHLPMMVAVSDIADRLQRSRTTIYRLWSTQEEFWADLAHFVVEEHQGMLLRAVRQSAPDGGAGGALEAALRTSVRRTSFEAEPLVWLASLAYAQHAPALATALTIRHRAVHLDLAHALAPLLAADGRRPADPLTIHDLASLLYGACETMAVQNLLDDRPSKPLTDRHGDAAALLGRALTVPVDHDRGSPRRPTIERRGPWAAAGPRPGRRDDRRLAVLRAARALLYERISRDARPITERTGRLRVPFSRLARTAGVARQTLYNRWPDNEAFELAVLHLLMNKPYAVHPPFPDEPGGTPLEAIEAVTYGYELGRLSTWRDAINTYLPYIANPAVHAEFAPFVQRVERTVPDRITAALAHGGRVMRPGEDTWVAGMARYALLSGAAHLHRTDPAGPWTRTVDGTERPLGAVASAILLRAVSEPTT